MNTKQRILVNVSNHPSENFTKEQKAYNELHFNQVYDIVFPSVKKDDSEEMLRQKAIVTTDMVLGVFSSLVKSGSEVSQFDVMVCGEFGLTYMIVNRLKSILPRTVSEMSFNEPDLLQKVQCDIVYPASERCVEELENGKSVHKFYFYGYRRYLDV